MLQKLTLILSASLLLTLTGFGTAIGAPKAPAADKKGAKAAEAPAEAPKPKPKPKPPLQRIRHAENGVSYKIVVRPGVPAVGKTFVVEVELAEILKVRHVRYGDRKPMDKADFQAILVAPKPKKRRAKRAAPIVRTGFKMKDAGTYGLTFTPTTAGLYSLHLRGKSSDGKIISYSMKMPVDVWPVPEDAIIEDIPKKLPATTLGNMENGKALCIERCRADLNFALYDKEDTLVSLSSEKVAGMNDSQFLKEILRDGSGSLSEMARNDILYYLHTTHLAITDLVPEASVIIANNFEINNYGIERLEKSLGKKPSDEELIA
ncbi:hypothetical protein KAI87_14630, partial [Myxococcota bacterium]|nr:hypothetical protein [Myxococcota bacterium]